MKKARKKRKSLKKHFEKYWLHYTVGIVIVLILLSFFVTFFFTTKFDFLIKEELRIGLDPLQDTINVAYDEPVEFEFEVRNDNFWFCKAQCTFELYDAYADDVLFKETNIIKHEGNIKKRYDVEVNTNGHGQRLYYFTADCNNMRSFFCKTDEQVSSRSSLITVNYDLPESEAKIKENLNADLNMFSASVDDARLLYSELSQIRDDIAEATTVAELKGSPQIAQSESDLNKYAELWQKESYFGIDSLFSESDLDKIDNTVTYLESQRPIYSDNINIHNSIVNISSELGDYIVDLDGAFQFYLMTGQESKAHDIRLLSRKTNSLVIVFSETNFEDISYLKLEFINLSSDIYSALLTYASDKADFDAIATQIIDKHKVIQGRLYSKLGLIYQVPTDTCTATADIIKKYEKINTDATDFAINYSAYTGSLEFAVTLRAYTQEILTGNISLPTNMSLNITPQEYYRLIQLNYSDVEDFNTNSCKLVTDSLLPYSQPVLKEISLSNYTTLEKLDVTFGVVPPKCCIFGDCSDCEIDSSRYPVIMLHGHSFTVENPIEASLASFYNMQSELAEDKLFINAGDIDRATSDDGSVWSMMPQPIAVRASYYYIMFYDFELGASSIRKTESIETYAIRLKDLIELVKTKTGAEKVNIVAHSMGGLVAREYLVLFGEDNVDKLVLIGTPNAGVGGAVGKLCGNIGAESECDDLEKGSIFLKRLNTDKNIPEEVEVHTVYGTGCMTEGVDGDGIATKDSVKLDFAENHEIEGTCDDFIGIGLHEDLLNPDKYPEVYDLVVDILS